MQSSFTKSRSAADSAHTKLKPAQMVDIFATFRPKPTPPRNPATLILLGLLPANDSEQSSETLESENA